MAVEPSDPKPSSRISRPATVAFADAKAAALLTPSLEELAGPPPARWSVVKRNASRTVYRGQIEGRPVYLKHFHPSSPMHRLARKLGQSDARNELELMRYLRDHGVRTAPPLAATCGDGTEWVASEAVEPSESADRWHARQLRNGPDGLRSIRRAAVTLGRLVGRMHAAGVVHADLHCGNVLVRELDGRAELTIIDLHRARRRRRLSRQARARNLAQLMHDRFDFTTRSDRLRFLHAYLEASQPEGTPQGWRLMVEHFFLRHRGAQNAQRDRRIAGNNRYFHKLALPGRWKGHVVLASKRHPAGSRASGHTFTPEQWREALSDVDALFDGPDVTVVKESRSGTVIRRPLQVGKHTLDVYLKRPRRKKRWKAPLDCFRRARPIRAFRLGHMLLTRRIATAVPLAAFEKRIGPWLTDSLLITEAVDAPVLESFLETWLSNPPRADVELTPPQQRQLAQEVLGEMGRMLQRLHDNSFAHRDLKATNMLVIWSRRHPPQLVLIDLDGLRRVRPLTARSRWQGLMRLNVSLLKCPSVNHAGRLRMLLGYLRRPGSGRIRFKPYWRILEQWSARKLRQQIRSRRKRQWARRRPRT